MVVVIVVIVIYIASCVIIASGTVLRVPHVKLGALLNSMQVDNLLSNVAKRTAVF